MPFRALPYCSYVNSHVIELPPFHILSCGSNGTAEVAAAVPVSGSYRVGIFAEPAVSFLFVAGASSAHAMQCWQGGFVTSPHLWSVTRFDPQVFQKPFLKCECVSKAPLNIVVAGIWGKARTPMSL